MRTEEQDVSLESKPFLTDCFAGPITLFSVLQTALAKASSKYDQMKTKALDYRSQTSSARTAVRQLKQEVRALEEELAAASHPIMPTPPPEVKIVEREVQVPVADPELVIKLQGLEGDIHSLLNQRKQAQR